MKLFTRSCLALVCATVSNLFAGATEDPVCPRCQSIREWNKEHHKNYQYYEDYVKDTDKGEKQEEPPQIEPKT